MSSEELKPCPFCGSPAKSDNGFLPAESITYAWCSNTECQLHSVDVGMTPADWNRRVLQKVDPQPPAETVMTDCITLPLRTVVDGRIWNLYTYEYRTPDGVFVGYLHALSMEHAAALLCDMKDGAELAGKIVSVGGE